jgi:hypothetical protein
MQRKGIKLFTDGDIKEIRHETQHEEKKPTPCQRATSKK